MPHPSRRRTHPAAALAALVVALAGLAASVALTARAATRPHVSEIHDDNAGDDVDEAVEVTAYPGADLTGWTLVLYNGNGGASYRSAPVAPAGVVDASGTAVVRYPVNGLQNGAPDGLALVRPDGSVAQLLSYDGVFTAVDGPAAGMATTDVGVAEPATTAARFGEVLLSEGGRLLAPTQVAEPGEEARAVEASNEARAVVLDDGQDTNLVAAGTAPPYLAPGDPVRVGDTLGTLQDSVLSYGFGAFRLQPADGTAEGTTFAATNLRPASPEAVGGDLHVAAFNVLNYFVTFGPDSRRRRRGGEGAPGGEDRVGGRAAVTTSSARAPGATPCSAARGTTACSVRRATTSCSASAATTCSTAGTGTTASAAAGGATRSAEPPARMRPCAWWRPTSTARSCCPTAASAPAPSRRSTAAATRASTSCSSPAARRAGWPR